ncbi:CvpA family protein [Singulisphaera sp. PoT]|uniref:CvpA family protein n=1 Tax=Singulisphaera sp. PoT TaxID=3411797 RepID=UPI003BF4B756
MTYYDGAMVGVIVAGMVWGALRGITWQIASIASLVLGYMVAHPLSAQLAPKFPGDPVMARALAMMAVYAGVSGGVFLAAWLIRATLKKMQFEAFDRHLGMVLGGLEGALIGLVATFFVASLAPSTRGPIFSSPTGKIVGQVMATVGPVLPTEAREALTRFWDGNGATASNDSDASDDDDSDADRVRSSRRIKKASIVNESSPRGSKSDDKGGSSWQDILEREESRISRAIVDTAKKELQDVGKGVSDGRTAERR